MILAKTKGLIAILTSVLLFSTAISAQGKSTQIPFTALPYYTYEPLTITIGKYQKELLTTDTTEIVQLANRIKADIDNTDIESLYFLSIRLYDLGRRDIAYYWFMTAQMRGRIFINILDTNHIGSIGSDAFERKQLFSTMNKAIGEYMHGYGFDDYDSGLAVYEKVKSEIMNIRSYKSIYPQINFLDDSAFEAAKAKKVEELTKAIDYFRTYRASVIKQRIEKGIQGKY